MFFKPLQGTQVLLRIRGGYRTAPVFEREGRVLAKIGGSYHQMTINGSICGTNATWVEFDGPHSADIYMGGVNVEIRENVARNKPALVAA